MLDPETDPGSSADTPENLHFRRLGTEAGIVCEYYGFSDIKRPLPRRIGSERSRS